MMWSTGNADIRKRFETETANHTMRVLHDDGLYRHLHFRAPQNSLYWFDLITVPGSLIFQGDGESFTFRRIDDMFEFFRGPIGRINPGYWAEKVTSGREHLTEYDEDEFIAQVSEALAEAMRDGSAPAGLGKALREHVLDSEITEYEEAARAALDAFEFQGFRFYDTWEWTFHRPKWWFIWALYAIVWGIAQYDGRTEVEPAEPTAQPASPAPVVAERVETLQPVGGVL